MSSPKFLGPHANLAATQYARIDVVRNLYYRIGRVAKRVLAVQLEQQGKPLINDRILTTAIEQRQKQETNISKENYYKSILMEIPNMTDILASSLLKKYKSLEAILRVNGETLAKVSYYVDATKEKRRKIGKKLAREILNHVGKFF